ncbi:histidine phosphotransferase [Iodidimonas muriae]|uniref:Histidine phosphotransferase n=1 Tax=Iodidimonas muriae TaxID=261467 RepID=A0ABQ2LF33_9PROT|nr:histidine phosphotransferase family protein [Iodidimonas muriae]GER07508.1 histidine phosphotransferase [Kordiimonadales bacterium JCM 17843]GGO14205.1 histidine phosphotransferase [Iodidimonas muriae]
MSSVSFAALLCSRLCHDLVSPVGALSNGLEILADEHDDAMRDQVLSLLDQSARQTANRLQFFRLAFGAGGGFGQVVDPKEGEKALNAFLQDSKITLEWNLGLQNMPKNALKLLLNLALLAGEGLIRGGVIRVESSPHENGHLLEITASGPRLIFSDACRAALEGRLDEDALEPRTAPAYLAGIVAKELPTKLDVEMPTAEKIIFRASFI